MKNPWSFSLFMSFRYLRGKHRHKLISVITLFSILGIAIGVMALIVVISVMEGFDQDLKKRILGVYAPITIGGNTLIDHYEETMEQVRSVEGVQGVSPFITGQIMARLENKVFGLFIRGIDPESEAKTTQINTYIKEGHLNFSSVKNGLVIGNELSRSYDLTLGDTLELLSPISIPTPLGLSSHSITFEIVGIFESGMYDYDSNLVFVSLRSGQELYGIKGRVNGITVNIDDLEKAQEMKEKIYSFMDKSIRVKTWIELNRNLFQALVTEKWLIFWILLLIVLVAAFNITSSLIMMVMEKTKEVGILKAMGATQSMILRIFVYQGFWVGGIGTLLGFVWGLMVTIYLQDITAWLRHWTGFEFFPRDVYYLNDIPRVIDISLYIFIVCCALILSLLAGIYPAWRASRLNPVDAIRYE